MKKILITTLAATIALASASTLAYAAKDGGKRGGGQHGPNIEKMLERLDANDDGGISLDEVKTHQANIFASADANDDQSLTQEEFDMIAEMQKAEREANKAERAETAEKDGKRGGKGKHRGQGKRGGPNFERFDADSSGSLTVTEFTSHADKMFERMDRNSDGVINADDMKRKNG